MVSQGLRRSVLLILVLLCGHLGAYAQSVPPRIFFTDITSGPNSGGETVGAFSGAYVTIYGNFFGTSQGNSTVTLNGANCLRVVTWGSTWLWYQKMVVQLGPSCTNGTGSFVVTTTNGASNGLPFTVRGGTIRFVSTSGADSGAGTFAAPWRTLGYTVSNMTNGDIAYAMNGVTATNDGAVYNAALIPGSPGTASLPKAVVAYPGATVTIGSVSGLQRGIMLCQGLSSCSDSSFWIFGGIQLRANELAVQAGGVTNFRLTGSDVTCPNGTGASACIEDANMPNVDLLGNNVHDVGFAGSDKTYHAIYYGSGSNASHETIAWNSVHDVQGCRGIQIHVDGSQTMTDIHLHDNLIYNIRCDGINLSTVNPDAGVVEVYNNVIYNAGRGPDPHDGSASYSGIRINGSASTGFVEVYNNTFYNCGSGGSDASTQGPYSVWIRSRLRNNIAVQVSKPYFTSAGGSSLMSGSNNLWSGGSGSPPSQTTGNITANPGFVSTSTPDFHLQSGSPAIDAGLVIGTLTLDHDGTTRPQGAGFDIGAYEFFAGGSTVQRPNPPTNLAVVVQ